MPPSEAASTIAVRPRPSSDGAEVVDHVVHSLGDAGKRGREHEEGENPERQIDVEDPAPAEVAGQKATEQRPGDAGQTEHGTEQARVAASLARRHDIADRGLRADHQPAATQPLQRAKGDQLIEALALTAERRADQEHDQAGLQHDLAPVHVAELPVQRRDGGLREQVGGDDPGDVVQAAEVADDRGQRGRDDRLIECRQQHHEQQASEYQP